MGLRICLKYFQFICNFSTLKVINYILGLFHFNPVAIFNLSLIPTSWHNIDPRRRFDFTSLYGLKQVSRMWFTKLKVLKQLGFNQIKSDYALFNKINWKNKTFILAYVDDLLITGNNLKLIFELKKKLANFFNIKDLGKLKYFLGLEFTKIKEGIFLNQRKYALKILEQNNYIQNKTDIIFLNQENIHYIIHLEQTQNKKDKILDDPTEYKRIVGKLVYLTVTRPDITYAVNNLSQHMAKPTEEDTQKVHKVLRYIKGSPGRGLFFSGSSTSCIEAFSDSDWASCSSTRKSTIWVIIS